MIKKFKFFINEIIKEGKLLAQYDSPFADIQKSVPKVFFIKPPIIWRYFRFLKNSTKYWRFDESLRDFYLKPLSWSKGNDGFFNTVDSHHLIIKSFDQIRLKYNDKNYFSRIRLENYFLLLTLFVNRLITTSVLFRKSSFGYRLILSFFVGLFCFILFPLFLYRFVYNTSVFILRLRQSFRFDLSRIKVPFAEFELIKHSVMYLLTTAWHGSESALRQRRAQRREGKYRELVFYTFGYTFLRYCDLFLSHFYAFLNVLFVFSRGSQFSYYFFYLLLLPPLFLTQLLDFVLFTLIKGSFSFFTSLFYWLGLLIFTFISKYLKKGVQLLFLALFSFYHLLTSLVGIFFFILTVLIFGTFFVSYFQYLGWETFFGGIFINWLVLTFTSFDSLVLDLTLFFKPLFFDISKLGLVNLFINDLLVMVSVFTFGTILLVFYFFPFYPQTVAYTHLEDHADDTKDMYDTPDDIHPDSDLFDHVESDEDRFWEDDNAAHEAHGDETNTDDEKEDEMSVRSVLDYPNQTTGYFLPELGVSSEFTFRRNSNIPQVTSQGGYSWINLQDNRYNNPLRNFDFLFLKINFFYSFSTNYADSFQLFDPYNFYYNKQQRLLIAKLVQEFEFSVFDYYNSEKFFNPTLVNSSLSYLNPFSAGSVRTYWLNSSVGKRLDPYDRLLEFTATNPKNRNLALQQVFKHDLLITPAPLAEFSYNPRQHYQESFFEFFDIEESFEEPQVLFEDHIDERLHQYDDYFEDDTEELDYADETFITWVGTFLLIYLINVYEATASFVSANTNTVPYAWIKGTTQKSLPDRDQILIRTRPEFWMDRRYEKRRRRVPIEVLDIDDSEDHARTVSELDYYTTDAFYDYPFFELDDETWYSRFFLLEDVHEDLEEWVTIAGNDRAMLKTKDYDLYTKPLRPVNARVNTSIYGHTYYDSLIEWVRYVSWPIFSFTHRNYNQTRIHSPFLYFLSERSSSFLDLRSLFIDYDTRNYFSHEYFNSPFSTFVTHYPQNFSIFSVLLFNYRDNTDDIVDQDSFLPLRTLEYKDRIDKLYYDSNFSKLLFLSDRWAQSRYPIPVRISNKNPFYWGSQKRPNIYNWNRYSYGRYINFYLFNNYTWGWGRNQTKQHKLIRTSAGRRARYTFSTRKRGIFSHPLFNQKISLLPVNNFRRIGQQVRFAPHYFANKIAVGEVKFNKRYFPKVFRGSLRRYFARSRVKPSFRPYAAFVNRFMRRLRAQHRFRYRYPTFQNSANYLAKRVMWNNFSIWQRRVAPTKVWNKLFLYVQYFDRYQKLPAQLVQPQFSKTIRYATQPQITFMSYYKRSVPSMGVLPTPLVQSYRSLTNQVIARHTPRSENKFYFKRIIYQRRVKLRKHGVLPKTPHYRYVAEQNIKSMYDSVFLTTARWFSLQADLLAARFVQFDLFLAPFLINSATTFRFGRDSYSLPHIFQFKRLPAFLNFDHYNLDETIHYFNELFASWYIVYPTFKLTLIAPNARFSELAYQFFQTDGPVYYSNILQKIWAWLTNFTQYIAIDVAETIRHDTYPPDYWMGGLLQGSAVAVFSAILFVLLTVAVSFIGYLDPDHWDSHKKEFQTSLTLYYSIFYKFFTFSYLRYFLTELLNGGHYYLNFAFSPQKQTAPFYTSKVFNFDYSVGYKLSLISKAQNVEIMELLLSEQMVWAKTFPAASQDFTYGALRDESFDDQIDLLQSFTPTGYELVTHPSFGTLSQIRWYHSNELVVARDTDQYNFKTDSFEDIDDSSEHIFPLLDLYNTALLYPEIFYTNFFLDLYDDSSNYFMGFQEETGGNVYDEVFLFIDSDLGIAGPLVEYGASDFLNSTSLFSFVDDHSDLVLLPSYILYYKKFIASLKHTDEYKKTEIDLFKTLENEVFVDYYEDALETESADDTFYRIDYDDYDSPLPEYLEEDKDIMEIGSLYGGSLEEVDSDYFSDVPAGGLVRSDMHLWKHDFILTHFTGFDSKNHLDNYLTESLLKDSYNFEHKYQPEFLTHFFGIMEHGYKLGVAFSYASNIISNPYHQQPNQFLAYMPLDTTPLQKTMAKTAGLYLEKGPFLGYGQTPTNSSSTYRDTIYLNDLRITNEAFPYTYGKAYKVRKNSKTLNRIYNHAKAVVASFDPSEYANNGFAELEVIVNANQSDVIELKKFLEKRGITPDVMKTVGNVFLNYTYLKRMRAFQASRLEEN